MNSTINHQRFTFKYKCVASSTWNAAAAVFMDPVYNVETKADPAPAVPTVKDEPAPEERKEELAPVPKPKRQIQKKSASESVAKKAAKVTYDDQVVGRHLKQLADIETRMGKLKEGIESVRSRNKAVVMPQLLAEEVEDPENDELQDLIDETVVAEELTREEAQNIKQGKHHILHKKPEHMATTIPSKISTAHVPHPSTAHYNTNAKSRGTQYVSNFIGRRGLLS